MGSNGAGKSTVWDALVWCLTGASVRGERASDLASWGANQRPHVVAVFLIDGESYTIDRTGSPDTLLINGEGAPQTAVDQVLGLSRTSLMHSVIFGQAAKLFMDLSVPERGVLIDEMMGTGVWLQRAEFAAKKSAAMLTQLDTMGKSLLQIVTRSTAMEEQLEGLQLSERIWREAASEVQAVTKNDYLEADAALREAEQSVRAEQKAVIELRADLDAAEANVKELQSTIAAITQDRMHTGAALAVLEAERQLLIHHQVCPQCKQTIDPAYAAARKRELSNTYSQLDGELATIDTDLAEAKELLNEATKTRFSTDQDYGVHRDALANFRGQIALRQQTLAQARAKLDKADRGAQESPVAAQIDATETRLAALAEDAQTIQNAMADLNAEQTKVDYWKQGFRRVRLFLVRRILAMLEIETAAAAASVGVGKWHIAYSVEQDTRSPGIHINVTNAQDQGKYKSYSYGETQRIKLAVSFGLASLMQTMAGVYYGLEVLDEPTAYLSPEGIEDLLDCLDSRAASTGKAVWLSDQHSLNYPFAEVWQVTKTAVGAGVEVV
jgi:DNA repair exonuclease SbcCD ATPase subunit